MYGANDKVSKNGDTMTGGLNLPALQLTTGPANGAVMTSDAAGNASWQTPGVVSGVDYINVRSKGATGTGTTDDTVAVQAAITAAANAGGGVVYFPVGQYLCTPGATTPALTVPSNVRLVGAGRKASVIVKGGNGVLISMSGPGTDVSGATHCRYSSLEHLAINGGGRQGLALQLYYADNLLFRDVYITSNSDLVVDSAEFWDSRFEDVVIESCTGTANSTTQPNVWLRNSAAASGFGYSGDSVNQIYFTGCRFENFGTGALWITQGPAATNNPNGIYIVNCKFEADAFQGGPFLKTDASCTEIFAKHLYLNAGGFASGYSTPQNIISWAASSSSLEDVYIANEGAATINSGVDLYSGPGTTSVLRNVIGHYQTAPVGSHIYFESSSTGAFLIENCSGSSGAQTSGTVPTSFAGQAPINLVAGVPSDTSFPRPPLNGSLALNTTTSQLYARIAGSWQPTWQPGNVQAFTASGTWTKPVGATTVTVTMIGGGGGGGSGAAEASGTVASGGAGGGGGAYTTKVFAAASLNATESVTVGAGGTGGAAVTASSTVGNSGGAGGNSVFKSASYAVANGGGGGAGGGTGAAAGGYGGGGLSSGGSGGSSSATGAAGSSGTSVGIAGPGGGSGGGITTAAANSAGGAGGSVSASGGNAGGTAGTSGGGAGGTGATTATGVAVAGTGGGGGGSGTTTAAGAGGVAGSYGAGGGGGGGALNGQSSGAGGAGAGGIVIVCTSS
jgi:hypothetical protein